MQVRVLNDSCEVHPHFQRVIDNCYAEYTEEVEDREPFGQGVRVRASPSAWMYQVASLILPSGKMLNNKTHQSL